MAESNGLENRQVFIAPLGFKSLSLHQIRWFCVFIQLYEQNKDPKSHNVVSLASYY